MDLYLLPVPVRIFKNGRINRRWFVLHGCLEHFTEQIDYLLDNPEKVCIAKGQLRKIISEYGKEDNHLNQMKNAFALLETYYDYISWN